MGNQYVLAICVGTTASAYQYLGVKSGVLHLFNDVDDMDVLRNHAEDKDELLALLKLQLGNEIKNEVFEGATYNAEVVSVAEARNLLKQRDSRRQRLVGENHMTVVVDFWNTIRPQTYADSVGNAIVLPPVATAREFIMGFTDLSLMPEEYFEDSKPDFTMDAPAVLKIVDFHSAESIIREYMDKYFGDVIAYEVISDAGDIGAAIGTADLYIASNSIQFDGRFVETVGIAGHRQWNQAGCEWGDKASVNEFLTNRRAIESKQSEVVANA